MLRLFDQHFRENKWQYLAQCILATFTIFALMAVLDAKKNPAIIASLGASSFIAFTMPHTRVSKARFLVGGYIVGILSGFFCCHLSQLSCWEGFPLVHDQAPALFGGLAVGMAILIMVLTDLEHPPAAGVALGLVLNNAEPRTLLIVFLGIVSLSLVKRVIRPLLMDLL